MASLKRAYAAVYREAKEALAGVPDGELDARLLLEAACGTDLTTLLADPLREVGEEEYRVFAAYVGRRKKREPLAYILGRQEFMGLPFWVDGRVLIPNQDTEILAEQALARLRDGMRILDLCTGSGCILLSLLKLRDGTTGIGTDISPEALLVAEENAGALGLSDRAELYCGDLFDALPEGCEPFDMIVSNPPYIAEDVIGTLEDEVRVYEPYPALSGGPDGLVFYRRIIAQAPRCLNDGGLLLTEIGFDQGGAVSAMMEDGGFSGVCIVKDFGGKDRVVIGRRPQHV